MMAQLTYIVLLLLISLIPSEPTSRSGDDTSFDKLESVVYQEWALQQIVTVEQQLPYTVALQNDKKMPTPLFIDMVVRTSDWFTHCKVELYRLTDTRFNKKNYPYKILHCPVLADNVYIPPLKYYVYALEKIIT